MKANKLRKKLSNSGLVLLKHGDGWQVTNNGTAKTLWEREFETLDAVEQWYDSAARRLSEQESDEFDEDWAKFCVKENANWSK
jgi:hypothetical protein